MYKEGAEEGMLLFTSCVEMQAGVLVFSQKAALCFSDRGSQFKCFCTDLKIRMEELPFKSWFVNGCPQLAHLKMNAGLVGL